MTKADKMRLENEQAFNNLLDHMVRLSFPETDWATYMAKHFGPNGLKVEDAFETPRNPLTIGNPHHNDPLDPENNQ